MRRSLTVRYPTQCQTKCSYITLKELACMHTLEKSNLFNWLYCNNNWLRSWPHIVNITMLTCTFDLAVLMFTSMWYFKWTWLGAMCHFGMHVIIIIVSNPVNAISATSHCLPVPFIHRYTATANCMPLKLNGCKERPTWRSIWSTVQCA